ncbi:MAG: glutamate-1-semialdehyde 2,1-aminomutase [Syntrophobacterales bacterium]|jgi:glutamate-1-semialdehyde 2,1-aminomutase|nr:glutamate-1-semialdehyde 2,1-aminomutase [Syntrophobacterales bacterium]
MDSSVSKRLFQEAQEVIAGGVNSPVRAFKAVHSFPRFIKSAQGARITDADDQEYIDYVLSWGPMILGHSHPQVVQAIQQAAEKGTSYGAPTQGETMMGQLIKEAFPSMELLRMVSSGTEATMSAIRLARGYTGRDYVVKFAGGYHGHVDSLLVEPGSGAAALGIPGAPGIPSSLAGMTLSLPFNDPESFQKAINQYGDAIACVIVEPVPGNMGVVLPQPSFLEKIRALTKEHGIVLIFDEVITGFRLTYGGYQTLSGIMPDLTCLGKIIGGGLPVGVFGGRKEIMNHLAPNGPVYQAGTLSGNPLAMAAGCATLEILRNLSEEYKKLSAITEDLCRFIQKSFTAGGIPVTINQIGSMFTIFFSPTQVTDLSSAQKSDKSLFIRFFTEMLEQGIYMAPSPLEASFLSFAHTQGDIDKTKESIVNTLKKM